MADEQSQIKEIIKTSLKNLIETCLQLGTTQGDFLAILIEVLDEYNFNDPGLSLGNRDRDKNQILLTRGDMTLDSERNQVEYQNKTVDIFPKNALLLRLLMERAEETVSHREIIDHITNWSKIEKPWASYWVTVSRLRKQLEPLGINTWIKTVTGEGYKLQLGKGD